MTVIKISRDQVLKAIRTEPISHAGFWYASSKINPDSPTITANRDCPVCAVGGVLRTVLAPWQGMGVLVTASTFACATGDAAPGRFTTYAQAKKEAADMAHDGQYMAALSYLFEAFARRSADYAESEYDDFIRLSPAETGAARRVLRRFVEANFPEELTIDIGGAAPADGVEVFTP